MHPEEVAGDTKGESQGMEAGPRKPRLPVHPTRKDDNPRRHKQTSGVEGSVMRRRPPGTLPFPAHTCTASGTPTNMTSHRARFRVRGPAAPLPQPKSRPGAWAALPTLGGTVGTAWRPFWSCSTPPCWSCDKRREHRDHRPAQEEGEHQRRRRRMQRQWQASGSEWTTDGRRMGRGVMTPACGYVTEGQPLLNLRPVGGSVVPTSRQEDQVHPKQPDVPPRPTRWMGVGRPCDDIPAATNVTRRCRPPPPATTFPHTMRLPMLMVRLQETAVPRLSSPVRVHLQGHVPRTGALFPYPSPTTSMTPNLPAMTVTRPRNGRGLPTTRGAKDGGRRTGAQSSSLR